MRRSIIGKAGFLIFGVLLFIACDPDYVIDENKEITNGEWHFENRVPFEVEITDTSYSYNVYVNFRIGADYKYRNIYVQLHSTNPQKKTTTDRLEFTLADAQGKWLGSGLGDLHDYQLPAFKNVTMHQLGLYRFELEQFMREDILKDVKAVGVRVEKAYPLY